MHAGKFITSTEDIFPSKYLGKKIYCSLAMLACGKCINLKKIDYVHKISYSGPVQQIY